MHEDKLTAEQRIRLESVNQANARLAALMAHARPSPSEVVAGWDLLHLARQIEAYIAGGEW